MQITNSAAGRQPTEPDSTARINEKEATKARIRELSEQVDIRQPDSVRQAQEADLQLALAEDVSDAFGAKIEPAYSEKRQEVHFHCLCSRSY
jgi:hypothetical protein